MKGITTSIFFDNYFFSDLLKQVLESDLNLEVFIHQSRDEVAEFNPDLIITDSRKSLELPLDTMERRTRIIIVEAPFSPNIPKDMLVKLIEVGLVAIIGLNDGLLKLKEALENIISEDFIVNKSTLVKIIKLDGHPVLTEREQVIVKLLCQGFRNKEIMQFMNISEQAVKCHLNRLYKKTGVADRLQLALYAVRRWPEYLEESEDLEKCVCSEKDSVG
jgi:DNA-binding NarL/FixJ family response regulator